ncbi:MAG: ABC transporter permease, partial [Burkholderiaceae bacterium]|nr:ABC transporter permease [Burkholderiaceae bacterium]
MTALWALIRKDLILYRSDRRAWMMNLIMPVVLGAFFGYLFGGSGVADTAKVNVALTVQDDSPISKKIADGLRGDKTLQVEEMPQEQAQELVKKGKLNAAIVIPTGFGDAAGNAMFGPQAKPEIKIYYDPSQTMVLAMVKGLLTQQVMQTVSSEVFSGAGGSKTIDQSLAKLDQAPDRSETADLRQLLQSVKQFQGKLNADNSRDNPLKAGIALPFTTSEEALTSGPSR